MARARGLNNNKGAVLDKLMIFPLYSGLLLGLQWAYSKYHDMLPNGSLVNFDAGHGLEPAEALPCALGPAQAALRRGCGSCVMAPYYNKPVLKA